MQSLLAGVEFDTGLSADTTLSDVQVTETAITGLSRVSHSALASGMIIARMEASGDVPNLGIRAGTWYTWVDSVATGAWRAVHIPADPQATSEVLDLVVESVTLPDPPRVQWVAPAGPVGPWYPCPLGCCRKVYRPFER